MHPHWSMVRRRCCAGGPLPAPPCDRQAPRNRRRSVPRSAIANPSEAHEVAIAAHPPRTPVQRIACCRCAAALAMAPLRPLPSAWTRPMRRCPRTARRRTPRPFLRRCCFIRQLPCGRGARSFFDGLKDDLQVAAVQQWMWRPQPTGGRGPWGQRASAVIETDTAGQGLAAKPCASGGRQTLVGSVRPWHAAIVPRPAGARSCCGASCLRWWCLVLVPLLLTHRSPASRLPGRPPGSPRRSRPFRGMRLPGPHAEELADCHRPAAAARGPSRRAAATTRCTALCGPGTPRRGAQSEPRKASKASRSSFE